LSRHRNALGGGYARHIARILTHTWGAFTERLAFQRARIIVVPSEGIARELQSAYRGVVRGKIQVIPNPVNAEHFARPGGFEPGGVLRELDIPLRDAFVLSFCTLGHFERKGLRFVFEALALLQTENVYLVIIGGSTSEIREYHTWPIIRSKQSDQICRPASRYQALSVVLSSICLPFRL